MSKNRIYIVIALIFTVGIYYLGITNFENKNIDSLGTLGDFVGGNLNPILAFLSFIALLTTVRLQSEEMAASRDELRRSAEAQEASKKILDQQYRSQVIQQFENTFFSLLKQIREIEPDKDKVNHLINNEQFNRNVKLSRGLITRDCDTYSHYFRLIYQTLKFIKNKSKSDNFIEVKFYTNILRSTLTPSHTKLLATNSAILPKFKNDSYHPFKYLIEEYSLLEHMHFYNQNRIDGISLQIFACYEEKAFGDNFQLKSIKENNPAEILHAHEIVHKL